MHLLCMCSMLVPSEFSHLRKRSAKKIAFLHFPWKLPHFREREKVAETFRQCTFSFDNLLFFFFWFGWLLRRPPRRWNGLLVVHICWCTLGALLEIPSNFHKVPKNGPLPKFLWKIPKMYFEEALVSLSSFQGSWGWVIWGISGNFHRLRVPGFEFLSLAAWIATLVKRSYCLSLHHSSTLGWPPLLSPSQGNPTRYCPLLTPVGSLSGKKNNIKHKLFGPNFPRTFLTFVSCGRCELPAI